MTLSKTLNRWARKADGLTEIGLEREANLIRMVLSDVADDTREYRTWLAEDDAMVRSGKSRRWLRKRFPLWEQMGHAAFGVRSSDRLYRRIVVPMRLEENGKQDSRAA